MNPDQTAPDVPGFLSDPIKAPGGSVDPGRLTLHDIQWLDNPGENIARATVTVAQLDRANKNGMLWTDQDVQRGIKPESPSDTPVLLSLAAGYPDARYQFNSANADDMVDKLLQGQRMYLNPLTWNLRPGQFEAFYDGRERLIHIYDGRIFLPDSHHRHQAILKAIATYRDAPSEFPKFSPEKQLTIDIYFMTKSQEAEFFYEKNELGKPVSKSKSWDLTGQDPYASLAKSVIELSPSLRGNVNRVTDTLTGRNAQVVTLSTLRGMMATMVGDDYFPDDDALAADAQLIAAFYELLANVRPELGHLPIQERLRVRQALLVDAGVTFHGYALVAKAFRESVTTHGFEAAQAAWAGALSRLASSEPYTDRTTKWVGDFLARDNPLWRRLGVLQSTSTDRLAISNTRQTREVVGAQLLTRIGPPVKS